MSPLIAFYRGLGTDAEGRTLAEVWAFDDEAMEDVHDFIQWLFPLREPSRFNPDAPLLTEAEIAEFRRDPALRANLGRSFDRFLAFLGLARAEGVVIRGRDFAAKQAVWRYPNHNWLRITRVLHSLRLLGLEEEARAFFAGLRELRERGDAAITPDTFRYWTEAAEGAPGPG